MGVIKKVVKWAGISLGAFLALGFVLTLTEGTPAPESAASASPTAAPAASSPSQDSDAVLQAEIDAVQEENGFYPGPAKEKYYEAIALAYIQEDCEQLANIQDLWENPPPEIQALLDDMPEGAQADLVANALRARLLLECADI